MCVSLSKSAGGDRPEAPGQLPEGLRGWRVTERPTGACVCVRKASGESKDPGPTTECVSPATGRIPTGETWDPGAAAGQKASSWRDPHCLDVYISH